MTLYRRLLLLFSALLLSLPYAGFAETASTTDLASDTSLPKEDWVLPSYIIDATRQSDAQWPFEADDELLEIWFPQIADADCAVLRCGGETLMIDCATLRQGKRVSALLADIGIDHIDTILNTHPHNDHLMGFLTFSNTVEVGRFGICFHEYYTDWMRQALLKCYSKDIPIFHYGDGDVFTLGDATLYVAMKVPTSWKLNNKSSVMKLTYGERTMLFTADVENRGQAFLADVLPKEYLDAEILKFPHHGLEPLNPAFHEAVTPEYCIITNTNRNYHTAYELRRSQIPYLFTVSGYVHLVTDGQVWFVELLTPSVAVSEADVVNDAPQEE